MKTSFFLLAIFCAVTIPVFSQDSASSFQQVLFFPNKLFGAIDQKAKRVEQGLDKRTVYDSASPYLAIGD